MRPNEMIYYIETARNSSQF